MQDKIGTSDKRSVKVVTIKAGESCHQVQPGGRGNRLTYIPVQ